MTCNTKLHQYSRHFSICCGWDAWEDGAPFPAVELPSCLTGDETCVWIALPFPFSNSVWQFCLIVVRVTLSFREIARSGQRSGRPTKFFSFSKWRSQNALDANAGFPVFLRAWSLPASPALFPGWFCWPLMHTFHPKDNLAEKSILMMIPSDCSCVRTNCTRHDQLTSYFLNSENFIKIWLILWKSENFIIKGIINVSNNSRWNLPLFLLGLPDRNPPRLHSAFPLQSGEQKDRRMVRKEHAAQRSEPESRLIPNDFFPPFCSVICAFFFHFYTFELMLGLLKSFFLLFQACFFFGISDHTFVVFFVLRKCPNLIHFFRVKKLTSFQKIQWTT